jgi:hypothetical protein
MSVFSIYSVFEEEGKDMKVSIFSLVMKKLVRDASQMTPLNPFLFKRG